MTLDELISALTTKRDDLDQPYGGSAEVWIDTAYDLRPLNTIVTRGGRVIVEVR